MSNSKEKRNELEPIWVNGQRCVRDMTLSHFCECSSGLIGRLIKANPDEFRMDREYVQVSVDLFEQQNPDRKLYGARNREWINAITYNGLKFILNNESYKKYHYGVICILNSYYQEETSTDMTYIYNELPINSKELCDILLKVYEGEITRKEGARMSNYTLNKFNYLYKKFAPKTAKKTEKAKEERKEKTVMSAESEKILKKISDQLESQKELIKLQTTSINSLISAITNLNEILRDIRGCKLEEEEKKKAERTSTINQELFEENRFRYNYRVWYSDQIEHAKEVLKYNKNFSTPISVLRVAAAKVRIGEAIDLDEAYIDFKAIMHRAPSSSYELLYFLELAKFGRNVVSMALDELCFSDEVADEILRTL